MDMPLGKRGEGKAKRERRRRGAWEVMDRGRIKLEGEGGEDCPP